MKKISTYLPLAALILCFFCLKLPFLTIKISDTNIYFATAQALLNGKVLYRDIFFTNFPLIPYIAAFYSFISGNNLLFYFATSLLESAGTACIIYYIVLKEFRSRLLAFSTTLLFLFSFMILATSQHQSGVFLAGFFSALSYLFFLQKRFFLLGMTVGLALLAKAYTLPLLLAFGIFLLLKHRSNLFTFLSGFLLTIGVILLPSLVFAPAGLWNDIVKYSLTRSQGIEKLSLFWFILRHDFLFVILLLANSLFLRKHLFFGLFSLFGLCFFLLYKDTYYLYFVILLPILSLSLPYLYRELTNRFEISKFMLPTVLLGNAILCIFLFLSGYQYQQVADLPKMLSIIQKNHPSTLYGINTLTPALAVLSKTPILNGIIDTNDNIFRKGYLNATTLMTEAIKKHAMIVTYGAYYPDSGVDEKVLTEVVDNDLLLQNCTFVDRVFFRSENMTNTINFFKCGR